MKKKVLIIGVGFAGLEVLSILREQSHLFDIHVVDRKQYFEYTPAILDSIFEPQEYKKISLSYKEILKNTQFINGIIVSLSQNLAKVDVDGKILFIDFDFCVIATGSQYSSTIIKGDAIRLENRKKQFYDEIITTNDITVIGGGIVGVELASVSKFNGKNVTLISRGPILKSLPLKAQKYVQQFFKEQNINIEYDQNKQISKSNTVFNCIGNHYQTDFLDNYLQQFTKNNNILTNSFQQLSNSNTFVEHIFALGDISQNSKMKCIFTAQLQADSVAYNIIKLSQNHSNKGNLKKTPSTPPIYLISLGGNKTMFVYRDIVVVTIFAYMLKKFIEKTQILKVEGYYQAKLLWKYIHVIAIFIDYLFAYFLKKNE